MLVLETARGQPRRYVESWTKYESFRGMSLWHDRLDWIGGFPYEVASAPSVTRFFESRGYAVRLVHPTGGPGCIECVFEKSRSARASNVGATSAG